jgi:ABC-2 type transport system ATP-binding protein
MVSKGFVIEVSDLWKEYPQPRKITDYILHPFKKNSFAALKGINIKFKEAEFSAIVGLNGAGKSTLFRIMSGILLPTKGNIYVTGLELRANLQRIKEIVGFVSSEEKGFYWRLTAQENLEFFGALYGISRKRLQKRITDLCGLFAIKELNNRFYNYSSGYKERIFIMKALLNNPQVLFFDDPAKNLDYMARERLLNFVREELVRRQKKTVIVGTNSLESLEIYDRLIILDSGLIKAEGTMEELKQKSGGYNKNIREAFEYYVDRETPCLC